MLLLIACSPAITGPAYYVPEGSIQTLGDVKDLLEDFQYKEMTAYYQPTAEDVFNNGLKGDCRWGAELAEWACNEIGMSTLQASLKGKGGSDDHRICIAWTGPEDWHLFSLSKPGPTGSPLFYVHILASDWKDPVIKIFNYAFDAIRIMKAVQHDQGGVL